MFKYLQGTLAFGSFSPASTSCPVVFVVIYSQYKGTIFKYN